MLLNLIQGTEEWKDYRRNCVTATDFAVIACEAELCEYPFKSKKTVNMLIQDKLTNRTIPDNSYFARGREYESEIINLIIEHYNLDNPNSKKPHLIGECHTFKDNRRIMSSNDAQFDIYISDGCYEPTILEVKTSSKNSEENILENYYKFQVAHQIYCSNIKKGVLAIAWFKNMNEGWNTITQTLVNAAEVINKDVWLNMCNEFLLKLDNASSVPQDDLIIYQKYLEYHNISEELKQKSKLFEKGRDELKQRLIEKYPKGMVNNIFSMIKSTRSTIKYSDYIKDNNLEIPEKYRTQTEYFKIKDNNGQ